jgi:pimeloyl-ACP methyl ester carboxylesterase
MVDQYGALRGAAVKGVVVPTAVSVFPDELHPAPRSWAERAYPKLSHYNQVEKGGHFAAWEQPQLFSEEVRAGFRSLRAGVSAVQDTNACATRVAS